MKIEHKVHNDTLYILLRGELDEYAAQFTRMTLDELFTKLVARRIIIDLSELQFTDSTGIGVLIGRFKKARAKSIPIFLANPTRAVDKVFSMTGIYEIMPKIVG